MKEIQRQRSESKSDSGSIGRRMSASSTNEIKGKRDSLANTVVNGATVKENEKLIEMEKTEIGSVCIVILSFLKK